MFIHSLVRFIKYVYVQSLAACKTIPIVCLGIRSALTRCDPFSQSFARLAWKEPFTRSEAKDDDSVYNFFKRRLGDEVMDHFAVLYEWMHLFL